MAINDHIRTQKQKMFDTDFLKDAHLYETWDEVTIGATYDAEQTFEVTAEDIHAYNEAIGEPNLDLEQPLFCVPIAFWCLGKGRGSWIRSPGAINPGQKIEIYEPFKVGEVISIKMKAHDRWIKRGRHYLTYKLDYYNQEGKLKATWWGTLIIPPNRKEMLRYARAIEEAGHET